MIDLINEAEKILIEAKYQVIPYENGGKTYVAFENNTIFGLVYCFNSVEELLTLWQEEKNTILKALSSKFHQVGPKAWNIYTVLLTTEKANEVQFHRLQDIEEDLSETRKIVRSDLETTDDVRAALLSLLPFAYIPSLPPLDIKEEIRKRAQELPPEALNAFFSNTDCKEVAILLENGK